MTRHLFDLDRIGAGLPVATARAEFERASSTGAVVVTAPPGTGKSTFVPPLVADLISRSTRPGDAGPDTRVLLTQPRRVAVRAAARRIAELDRSPLGGPVGFTVRGERTVSERTAIEVLTPGVLLRRLLADPALEGVGAVILDEVHERSVDGDLLLGMIAEVRALREDLLVVAMSATLDATGIAELLGAGTSAGFAAPAAIVSVPSALHPLRIDHAPFAGPRLDERGATRDYLAHLAEVAAAAREREGCDALVFVPGAREVDEVVRLLRARIPAAAGAPEVLPLHGRIPAREQDRAVRGRDPADPPRIVVSTSLAESSLTVPGVRLVIDSGLSREVRRDRARAMTGLVTVSASRTGAEQRAGRAARQGPGRTVRVYSETDFARMPAASPPEIASADLTDTALLLAAWGSPRGVGLALPTAPPPAAVDAAVDVLHALDLIDAAGRATPLGARIARLPVGVREARALLDGARELRDPRLAADIVAAMSDDHRDSGADLPRLLRDLRAGRSPGAERWRRESRRLERIAGEEGAAQRATARGDDAERRAGGAAVLRSPEDGHEDGPGIVVALALARSGSPAAQELAVAAISSRAAPARRCPRAAGCSAASGSQCARCSAPRVAQPTARAP